MHALKAASGITSWTSERKYIVLMPEMPYNNAIVAPASGDGTGTFTVVPTMATANRLTEMGSPLAPDLAGCHEIVHYVHLLQMGGFWNVANAGFGEFLTSQIALEPWFIEGLATYYETKLQPGQGRMALARVAGLFPRGVRRRRVGRR